MVGKNSLQTSCLYIRNGKLDQASGGAGKQKAGKKTQGLLWMVNSLPKHMVSRPRVFIKPVVSENVFCRGMVVVLNQFIFYFLECFIFIKAKYVLQFSTRSRFESLTR